MTIHTETEARQAMIQLRADLAAGNSITHHIVVGAADPSTLRWEFEHGDTGYVVEICDDGGLYLSYNDGVSTDEPGHASVNFQDMTSNEREALAALVRADESAAEDVKYGIMRRLDA
ncbi:hypothetical protein [Kocuria sp.]|uniref:hypothetical protein n=1 Tax=Kocuria sp. TaxID=1871328 RepID=UPI0026DF35C1|nr:hypothetical protein [Kocuria sp.]MDO5619310.1 hypothetical protein [Kocuria sp.]